MFYKIEWMLVRAEVKFVWKRDVLQGDALITIFLSFLCHARSNILRRNLYIYTLLGKEFCFLFYGVNSLHTSAIKELPPPHACPRGKTIKVGLTL